MTAGELIELLRELDPETEVRLMQQPSWPFEYSIGGELWQPDVDDFSADETFEPDDASGPVAYIVEGRQLGYGTKAAWR